MATAAFANGVRLWKNAMTLRAVPAAQGAATKGGQSRKHGRVSNRSPNFLWDITVMTSIPPVTQINSDYGRQATHHLYMLQTGAQLVAQSKTLIHLAWVVDDSVTQDVNANATGGAAVDVTLDSFDNWTPVAGELVLFRNPTTGDGFVTTIDLVGAGPPYTIRCDLQRTALDRSTEDVDVTTAWKVYRCAYYFPGCQKVRPNWQDVPSQGEDKHSTATFTLRSEADPVYNTGVATLDLT